MSDLTIQYIGKRISLKSLSNLILDHGLEGNDSIILHSMDFDELILEYRAIYFKSMSIPFYLLTVLIKEDIESKIPLGRVGLMKNDDTRYYQDHMNDTTGRNTPDNSYAYETIYRCGWCGNIVDFDGSEFDPQTRQFKISIHQKFNKTITEKQVNGACCPNGNQR